MNRVIFFACFPDSSTSMTTTGGHDGNGTDYDTLDAVWGEGGHEWYSKAMDYWSQQDASINGVLGGFVDLHPIDTAGSEQFLNLVKSQCPDAMPPRSSPSIPPTGLGADCGAGVGRITQFLLGKYLSKIDLIEPCEKLIEQAKIDLPKTMAPSQIGEYTCCPLQAWSPPASRYNLLWHQWVLLYLTDKDCVDYLVRCRQSLVPGGAICIKENVALKGQFLVDSDDNSVTRTLDQYKDLFTRSGLKIAVQMRQGRWPTHLFPVIMFALVPM